MISQMNIKSAYIIAVWMGFTLLLLYVIIAHRMFQQHSLIEIQIHTSEFSYLSSLLDKRHTSQHRNTSHKHDVSGTPLKKVLIAAIAKRKYTDNKKIKDPAYSTDIDIMNLKRPTFLKEYRNPCWYTESHTKSSCRSGVFGSINIKEHIKLPVLRCLPYFYYVGQPRCGITNIYNRLIKHPDIIAPPHKDNFWFQRHRFVPNCSSLNVYLDYFHGVSQRIQMNKLIHPESNTSYYSKVTGDCSGDIMWDNTRWHDLPSNQGCKDPPCFTNADYIKHMHPDAKIIVSFRDPVERIYSEYLAQSVWLKYEPDNQQFHKLILEQIYNLNSCLKKTNTLRLCLYDSRIQSANSKVRLGIGLYYVYLQDWYRVFPRKQIHIIQFENYLQYTGREMARLFRYLGLRQLNQSEMVAVMMDLPTNSRTKVAAESDMWNETRSTLNVFYRPYNKMLVKLLSDNHVTYLETANVN